MAVTMRDVRAILDPEEPDYVAGALLGPGALPHLRELIDGGDPMLASKATYLAGLIPSDEAAEIVDLAAHSDDPTVRVAAAAAAHNLPNDLSGDVLATLASDDDDGVRRVAQGEAVDSGVERRSSASSAVSPPSDVPRTGLMPGETPGERSDLGGLMPGETPRDDDGSGKMPGE